MTTLKLPIRKCPKCGSDLEIHTYRPSMCGSPYNYYELIWHCPLFDCFIFDNRVRVRLE